MLKFDWNILFTLINLIIFYFLMKKFLFKPIFKVMNERKEIINKKFDDAESAKGEALELKKQYENKLQGADDEKARIINEAKESAKDEYGKIIGRAEDDVKKMKETAKKQIDEESEKVFRSAKENIVSLAMDAAEKVVGKSVSSETNNEILDEFLNESSGNNES
ncbi:MAG: F0F1 ATP synthase subunit B [Clostridiales bacterium]|nr:F0F1 ATP synthase subunit B [Clostridiales bacterium]